MMKMIRYKFCTLFIFLIFQEVIPISGFAQADEDVGAGIHSSYTACEEAPLNIGVGAGTIRDIRICNSGLLWMYSNTDQVVSYDGQTFTTYSIPNTGVGRILIRDSKGKEFLYIVDSTAHCFGAIEDGTLSLFPKPYDVELPVKIGHRYSVQTVPNSVKQQMTFLRKLDSKYGDFNDILFDSKHSGYWIRNGVIMYFDLSLGWVHTIGRGIADESHLLSDGGKIYLVIGTEKGNIDTYKNGNQVGSVPVSHSKKKIGILSFRILQSEGLSSTILLLAHDVFRLTVENGNAVLTYLLTLKEENNVYTMVAENRDMRTIFVFNISMGLSQFRETDFHVLQTAGFANTGANYSTAFANDTVFLSGHEFWDIRQNKILPYYNRNVSSLKYSANNTLYALSDRQIVKWVNTKWIRISPTLLESQFPEVRQMTIDGNGKLWFSSDSLLFDIRYPVPLDLTVGGLITFLSGELDDRLWIGTTSGFLIYDQDRNEVVQRGILPGKIIRDIYPLNGFVKVIVTYGHGLYLWDGKEARSFPKNKPDELNFAHRMIADSCGSLWVTTNSGLFQFDRNSVNLYSMKMQDHLGYRYYESSYGFPVNEFNGGFPQCGVLVNSALMVLPTMNGLVYLDPNNFSEPDPDIEFLINTYLEGELLRSKNIKIGPGFDELKFQLIAPVFDHPLNRQFEYRMPGYSETWKPIARDGILQFNFIPFGEYELQVRQIRRDSRTHFESLNFVVMPYWYQKEWFKILEMFALLGIIFSVARLRSWHLRKKAIRLQKEVDRQKIDLELQNTELNNLVETLKDAQDDIVRQMTLREKLLGMISHDVMGNLFDLTKLDIQFIENNPDNISKYLGIYKTESQKVYTDMKNILNWVKAQREEFEVRCSEFDLYGVVEDISTRLRGVGRSVPIKFINRVDPKTRISCDREMIRSVLWNLVNNEAKHSKGGSVSVYCEKSEWEYEVTLINNNDSFPDAEKVNEFMRKKTGFENIDLHMEGGFGLILIRTLLIRLNGYVKIENLPRQGHMITITIPANICDKSGKLHSIEHV